MKGAARHLSVLVAGLVALGCLHLAIAANLAHQDPSSTPWLGTYQVGVLNLAGINIILAVSLNLINGTTGQFSIGHMGFAAVGGYTAATLVKYLPPPGLEGTPLLLTALLLGGLAAAACGLLVGLPALRLKGDYLAIATLGFGEIIRVLLLNSGEGSLLGHPVDLGGARGFTGIPHLASFGIIYACAWLTVWMQLSIVCSSQGRALLAIREDELAARVMGVDVTRGKVMAFCLGAFFAGVAGGLFAHEIQILQPNRFGFLSSFEIVVMVVLGGMGSTSGAVLAAVFVTLLPEGLRDVSASLGQHLGRPDLDLRLIIYALMLITLMLVRPQGLLGRRELLPLGWLGPESLPPDAACLDQEQAGSGGQRA